MDVLIMDTWAKQAEGLQHLRYIPRDTLYVFPLVEPGTYFHSQNVPESFDIAFLDARFVVLEVRRVIPPRGGAWAPAGTTLAVESKAGFLEHAGFVPGNVARF